jgi:hypothetical protein
MHLVGVWKDVECTFGIQKKRWWILNNGFFHREMEICEKIFITCCWLNNFLMLDVMERTNVRVGHGAPISVDGIWLSGTTEVEPEATEENDRNLSVQFLHRRSLFVDHLHLFLKKGAIQDG